MSLDLLKEKFGGSTSTNKKEVDKKKLNEMFVSKPVGDIKSFKAQYQNELAEKDRIIENLKQELNSQWLTNQTAFNTKKLYEDKIKKMDIVDWNDYYWEINGTTEPQLFGGHPNFKHNIVATANRSRLSSLQIEERPR